MSFTQILATINANTGKIVDASQNYIEVRNSKKPKIHAESKCVLCCHWVDDSGNDYPLAAGDTFELGVDIDFEWIKDSGTLSGNLTALSAITSVTASGLTVSDIPDTGHIRVYNSSGEMERIEYSAYNSGTGVFTVDHTMVSSFSDGDRLVVEDELMCYSDNDMVDIAGDWDDIDRTAGKVSIRIDATADIFKEKITATSGQQEVKIQIRRYPSGETNPSNMLQDTCYAFDTVINTRENPAVTNPSYLTQTSADARYQLKDTDAVENNLANFDASGNAKDSGIASADVALKSDDEDIEITDANKGFILADRTTATRYRLMIDNGMIAVEEVV